MLNKSQAERINTYIFFKKSMVAETCSNNRKNSAELSFDLISKLNDDNREMRERWLVMYKTTWSIT